MKNKQIWLISIAAVGILGVGSATSHLIQEHQAQQAQLAIADGIEQEVETEIKEYQQKLEATIEDEDLSPAELAEWRATHKISVDRNRSQWYEVYCKKQNLFCDRVDDRYLIEDYLN